jgi:hypothetical protein
MRSDEQLHSARSTSLAHAPAQKPRTCPDRGSRWRHVTAPTATTRSGIAGSNRARATTSPPAPRAPPTTSTALSTRRFSLWPAGRTRRRTRPQAHGRRPRSEVLMVGSRASGDDGRDQDQLETRTRGNGETGAITPDGHDHPERVRTTREELIAQAEVAGTEQLTASWRGQMAADAAAIDAVVAALDIDHWAPLSDSERDLCKRALASPPARR